MKIKDILLLNKNDLIDFRKVDINLYVFYSKNHGNCIINTKLNKINNRVIKKENIEKIMEHLNNLES